MFKLYSKRTKVLKLVIILLILSLSVTVTVRAQDKEQRSIVKADSTWRTEIIPFPIDWAPEIKYIGFEELRFAPNWDNKEHDQFWTLAMAWQVDTKTEIPLKDIQFNFNHYFDTLMKPNHWATEFPEPELVLSDLEVTESGTEFKGNITFFDGFHTGKVITVNILGNQILCKTSGKVYVIFRISPKDYNEAIWEELNAINLKDDTCLN